MKFRLAFKVHKDLFISGARHILTLPGIARFSVRNGMLRVDPYFNNNRGTFYVSSEYLVNSGYNDIAIYGDGTYIKVDVNSYTWTIFDATFTPAGITYYNISNFGGNAGTWTFNSLSSSEQISYLKFVLKLKVPTTTGIDNAGILDAISDADFRFTITNTGYLRWRVGSNTFLDLIADTVLPQNEDVYVRIMYDASTSQHYTLAQSPDNEHWTVVGSSTIATSPGYRWSGGIYLGTNRAGSSYALPLNSVIYLMDTDVLIRTANTSYTFNRNSITVNNHGTVSIDSSLSLSSYFTVDTDAHGQSGTPYPVIRAGYLYDYGHSWIILKDIEALKLED